MANPPFDASEAVTFDLSRGQIQKAGADARLLVSAGALAALCRGAGADATRAFALATGETIGSAIVARFERAGGNPKSATLEAVIELLAGELAVAGFGRLSAERWGRAFVLVMDHAPGAAAVDELLVGLLGATVARATRAEVECVQLVREGDRARFLMTGRKGADKVKGWLRSGVSWGEVLVRLHPASHRGDA